MQDIILYATDTMADWEYSYLTAGLAMAAEFDPDRFRLRLLADDATQVTTKGRLRLLTDGDLSEVKLDGESHANESDANDIALLVLPGADTWETGHERVLELAASLLERGIPVAAICGATLGLARAGMLDDRPHTSNAKDMLEASGYKGADHYLEEKVVVDGDLITAPAAAPVDFSAAIFRRLELFPPEITDAWHGLYTTGERHYYDILVGQG